MLLNFNKVMLLIMMIVALAGCQDQYHTVQYLQNPTLLKATLDDCQQGKITGEACVNAQLTKTIINNFTQHAAVFFAAQEEFVNLQQQSQSDPANALLQQKLAAQTIILNDEFMRLEEGFGHEIMLTETQLVHLTTMQQQLNDLIKATPASDTKKMAMLMQQKANMQMMHQLLHKKIQIMLAFVGISNRVDG